MRPSFLFQLRSYRSFSTKIIPRVATYISLPLCVSLLQLLSCPEAELICNNPSNRCLGTVSLSISEVFVRQTDLLLTDDAKFDARVVTLSKFIVLRGSMVSLSGGHLIKFFEVAWIV